MNRDNFPEETRKLALKMLDQVRDILNEFPRPEEKRGLAEKLKRSGLEWEAIHWKSRPNTKVEHLSKAALAWMLEIVDSSDLKHIHLAYDFKNSLKSALLKEEGC